MSKGINIIPYHNINDKKQIRKKTRYLCNKIMIIIIYNAYIIHYIFYVNNISFVFFTCSTIITIIIISNNNLLHVKLDV